MALNGRSCAQQHCNGSDRKSKERAPNKKIDEDEEDLGYVRDEMKSFWTEHSKEATEEEMMLDSHAEQLGKEEIPEILSQLPDVAGMDVLELGAGIGRFTGHLANEARSVMAIDFMEIFVEKNRQLNRHHGNITFQQSDVTQLELPYESFDLVFSNWLLMYLEEKEVEELFFNILKWLRPGGFFFFRESCFHQSGDASRDYNPTKYRDPATYNNIIQSVSIKDGQETHAFEMIMSKSVQTYIKLKNNCNQICWLVHKSERRTLLNNGFSNYQEYLDKHLYSVHNIRSYETVFGEGFISSGGMETTQKFVRMLNLKRGEHVLDVGSGTGGSAFRMAQKYDVQVTGIDLSANMVALALQKGHKVKDIRVQFEVGDVTKRKFQSESINAIYCRESLLHIVDKESLLSSFHKWLKNGGRLVVADYFSRSDEKDETSQEFKKFIHQRGFSLASLNRFKQLLTEAEFVSIRIDDVTDEFIDILNKELEYLENERDEFLTVLPEPDYKALVNKWKDTLVQFTSGDLRYGLIYAEK